MVWPTWTAENVRFVLGPEILVKILRRVDRDGDSDIVPRQFPIGFGKFVLVELVESCIQRSS